MTPLRQTSNAARKFSPQLGQPGMTFRTADQTRYQIMLNGSIRKLNKDKRTPKQRKAARRALRAQKAI